MPSPVTRIASAATGIARSARPRRHADGWPTVKRSCCRCRYVVAGLAQLGRLDEARAALVDLRELDPNLASFERLARRLFTDSAPVDHILEGRRKAGYE